MKKHLSANKTNNTAGSKKRKRLRIRVLSSQVLQQASGGHQHMPCVCSDNTGP